MPDTKTITAQALELPEPDRAKLARQLLDSLESLEPPGSECEEIDAEWAQEIEARRREYEAGRMPTYSREEVMRAIDAALGS